jgi:hypothetical protein
MCRWLRSFVQDEAGFVSSPEWAIVATILVLGAITGIIVSQQASAPDVDPPALIQTQ